MAKFFVPLAGGREQAEQIWSETRKFLGQQGLQTTDRRIFKISYSSEGKKIVDEVDKFDRYDKELVLALFESESDYLCCTMSQGCARGKPIIIEKKFDVTITDFEPEECCETLSN